MARPPLSLCTLPPSLCTLPPSLCILTPSLCMASSYLQVSPDCAPASPLSPSAYLQVIGEGAFSKVHLGRWRGLDVAVKVRSMLQ